MRKGNYLNPSTWGFLEGPMRGTRGIKRTGKTLSVFSLGVTQVYRIGPERDSQVDRWQVAILDGWLTDERMSHE